MNLYAKRVLISLLLGVVFALVDIAITGTMNAAVLNIQGPFFWFVFFSRMPIGFIVGIIGVLTEHPLFPIIHMRYIRGIGIGILLSLGLAVSIFYDVAGTWSTFFMILGLGAVYGLLVDVIATWLVGDGKKLLSYEE